MEPINDLVFKKTLQKVEGETDLFNEAAKHIVLPSPAPNDSLEMGKDLMVIQGATYLRNKNLEKSIRKHDKDPAYAIKAYLTLFGLEYDEKFIEKVLKQSSVLALGQKNKYNKPRPKQLAPYFGIKFSVLGSKTNKTPSYPSGHSTQSHLVAEIYSEKYPEHRTNLLKASEECGMGRVSAGFHTPADHKAGVLLAKRLFKSLKGKKDPTDYSRVINF